MKDAEAVTFAGATLDRAAQLRGDPAALAALAAEPEARCLAVWRGRPLVDLRDGARARLAAHRTPPVRRRDRSADLPRPPAAGRRASPATSRPGPARGPLDEAAPGFLDDSRTRHPDLPEHLAFADLRAVMSQLGTEDAGVAAAAKGVLAWHASHGFCARCGAASAMADGGWKRVCPACGGQHFPRTDPVVIMLITRGEEVLLGRSPAWPPGMYSLLAGFMEPGESIEAAVRRETWEEAGHRGRRGRVPVEPALALPVEPDDRLPRPRADPRDPARPGRARGRALAEPRGGARRADRAATRTSAPRARARSRASCSSAGWPTGSPEFPIEETTPMTTSRIAAACAAACAAAAPAFGQDVAPALSATYVCDGAAVLQVAYLNPAEGPSLAVVAWAGELIPMQAGPTGSGVRYIAFDEQASFRWHSKGTEGTLLFLAADHTAEEEVVLAGCQQVER